MNKRIHHNGVHPTLPTCDTCMHMIRGKVEEGVVVCVQHLKIMPSKIPLICDLHEHINKKVNES